MPSELQELRDNLGQYYLALNFDKFGRPYRYVPYQQEIIIPALEAVERGEIKRLAIFMPPGHSKSDTVTRTFVPWFIGRHPQSNALVGSYSADLASDEFGAKIKARMQTPLHLKVFPKSRITKDSRSKTTLRTISGGMFYSVGFSGSWTGKRLDLIVLDDLIKSFAEADSTAIQEALFTDYKGMIKDRLNPDGAIVMCMHRWRHRDIAGRILELDGTVENGGAWTVIKLPAEDASGNFLWERKAASDSGFPRSYYEDFKKDEEVWSSKFQQDPDSSKSFKFKKDWLQFFDIPISPGKFNTYMLVDPAGAKNKKSDKTSIQVWAAGQDQKLFLADWVHDQLDPGERVETAMRLTRRWNQRQTIWEEFGLQSDVYYITKAMRESGFDTRLYPIAVGRSGPRHLLSKNERIDAIIPFWREGRMYLPRKFEVTLVNGKKMDLTKRFLDEEYNLFKGVGSIAHEDDLDCMSRLLEPELNIVYYEPPAEKEGPQIMKGVGSWEAVY